MAKLGPMFAVVLLLSAIALAQAQVHGASTPGTDEAIRAILQSQVDAWNHQDLAQRLLAIGISSEKS